MINENICVGQFLKELFKRPDGIVLILAMTLSLVMLLLNIRPSIVSENFVSSEKWWTLWAFMPLIFLFIHIRLRQLITTDSLFSFLLHVCVYFVILSIFIVKNGVLL